MFKPNQTNKTAWWFYSFIYYATEESIITAIYKSYTHITPNIINPNLQNWRNVIRFGSFGILASDIGQCLPKSTILPHPVGIVINSNAEIGENVNIKQNVTAGGNISPGAQHTSNEGAPKIRDNVTLCANCCIIGDVTIGEGSVIGANSTVISDIPPNSVAVGSPARIVRSDEAPTE